MRALIACVLLAFSLSSLADSYDELYETAGWTEQRGNFSDALNASLPTPSTGAPNRRYASLWLIHKQRWSSFKHLWATRSSLPKLWPRARSSWRAMKTACLAWRPAAIDNC